MASPSPFEAAVSTVIAALPEADYEALRLASDEAVALQYFSLGIWIRNNLGLWNGNEGLKNQMSKAGVGHEDDMSAYVLLGVRAVLNGRPADSTLSENLP